MCIAFFFHRLYDSVEKVLSFRIRDECWKILVFVILLMMIALLFNISAGKFRNVLLDWLVLVRISHSWIFAEYFHLEISGLAVLINRIGKSEVTVGVDGSLYRYHPRFKRNMERCMESLVHKDIKVSPREEFHLSILIEIRICLHLKLWNSLLKTKTIDLFSSKRKLLMKRVVLVLP